MSMTQQQQDKWRMWLKAIQEEGTGLSAWEENFIADISIKFDTYTYVFLSDRQAEQLERIYAEHTS